MMIREDEDGTPYMCYFRPDVQLSFAWSGDPDRPIQVMTEGTNGPVRWQFFFREQFSIPDATINLNNFMLACQEWLWYAQNTTGQVPYTDPLDAP